jgi:hypothetical protein
MERNLSADVLWDYRTKLDAAIESMNDAVFISDNDGHFIHFADRKLLFWGSRLQRCEPPLPADSRSKIDLFSVVREAAGRC